MNLSPEDVDDIIAVLDSSPYDELDLDIGRFTLRLRREATGWTKEQLVRSAPAGAGAGSAGAGAVAGAGAGAAAGAGAGSAGAGVSAAAAGTGVSAAAAGTEEAATAGALGIEEGARDEVRSPLPGVFYRAPRPGAPPFVEIGDQVEPDTVVGLIETMKLMNAVPAGTKGTVVEICAGNGEAVAEGAALVRMRPS